MGLLQKAAETYDAMAHRIGEINEGEKEPLAPVSHTITRAQIEITLDQDGCFLTARALGKDDPKIIIYSRVYHHTRHRGIGGADQRPLCPSPV